MNIFSGIIEFFKRKRAESVLEGVRRGKEKQVAEPKPGPDIIARQGGQKRNKTHIYRQPYGYPIRLCDWIYVDKTNIEVIGECQGVGGPAEMPTLAAALDWAETKKKVVVCKHCQSAVVGRRFSMANTVK